MNAALADSGARRHALGVGLVLGAGLLWSSAGPLVRAIEQADVWQILFYKSLWMTAAVFAWLVWRHRLALGVLAWRGGRLTVLGALCLIGSNVGWLLSITNTSVANTLLLQAATPMVDALLAFAILGERVARVTWAAMIVALIGVAVMVGDGALGGRLFGNVAGLGAVLSFAAFAVVLRAGRDTDLTVALCLAGVGAAAFAWTMADSLDLTARDHALCFVMGTAETGLGLVLFTLGARYVPAGELVLLTLLEVFIGPVLVWLLFGEVPALGTLAGGALVVVAVGGQTVIGLRRPARTEPTSVPSGSVAGPPTA